MSDPLHKANDGARVLFEKFSRTADANFTTDDVVGAAVNLLLNALRQRHNRREDAEKHFDELVGRSKVILMEHYQNGVRRQGVFPFPQTIEMPLFQSKNKLI